LAFSFAGGAIGAYNERQMADSRIKTKEKPLDALDRAILAALLEDARLSQVELAERIPLSPTAIARRIHVLEEAGVIDGYQVRINGAALDLGMTVVVHIGLKSQTEDVLDAFERAVVKAPSVVSCYLMSGEDDYLLTVMARDLPDFERIHKQQLSRLPGVARMKSSFALRDVARKGLRDLLRS
jgi:Lrp/AsnC family transcriptional regulator, leucine-responsive regulatory protein